MYTKKNLLAVTPIFMLNVGTTQLKIKIFPLDDDSRINLKEGTGTNMIGSSSFSRKVRIVF